MKYWFQQSNGDIIVITIIDFEQNEGLVAVDATGTSHFVAKVEKGFARESETLPTSRPGVDACSMSLCKLRRNGIKGRDLIARKVK